MVCRWSCCIAIALGVLLVSTSGCPEPGDEAGDELGDTGDTGDTNDDDDGRDPGNDDDVRPPPIGDGDGDETGDGDGEPGDGDGEPGDGDGDGGPFDDPDRCWDDTWSGNQLPHVILGNTTGRVDSFTGTCGLGPAPDYQLGFVAPWTGSFVFDTSGSSFDTVVYVHEGECGATELVCNDDFLNLESRVVVELDANEMVTVSVDGTGPFEEGLFTLEISEFVGPVCDPEFIQPNLPTVELGDTTGAPSQLASGCGGEGAPEQVYEFVAPGAGSYRFNTLGSSFDTVLYVLDECDAPALACNDDAGFDLQSELILELVAGQHLLIVVDGFGPGDAGPYLLNVIKL